MTVSAVGSGSPVSEAWDQRRGTRGRGRIFWRYWLNKVGVCATRLVESWFPVATFLRCRVRPALLARGS